MRSCSQAAHAGAKQGWAGRSCCSWLAQPKGSFVLWQRRGEKPAMDLRRLCCVGLCACGASLVALEVPSLRFMLASQAGLAIGWRVAAMPSNVLAPSMLQEALLATRQPLPPLTKATSAT